MRIVVVQPMNGGGLVHFDYQLCNALASAGADVTLITGTEYELSSMPHNFTVLKMLKLWKSFDEHPASADLNLIRRSISKLYRNMRRVVRGVRVLSAWISLTRYLFKSKPDWIQFTRFEYPFEAFFVLLLKRSASVGLSQMCHEFESRERAGFFSRFLYRLDARAYRSFSKIFFLSEDSRTRFLSLFHSVNKDAAISIPHGNSEWLTGIQAAVQDVNLRSRYGLMEQERVILFFGLLAPSKGVEDLIEAFSLAVHSCDAKLVIAGYPTKFVSAAQIKHLLNDFGIADKVILDLRYVPLNEIGALMDLATVVVYPYRSSTQSGSLQAAYTFGKPVIATAVGGLPEVVDDGKSGFLVQPHSATDLAEKISLVINDPTLAAEMGRYARHLSVTRFNWDSIAVQMLDQYKDLSN